MEREPLPPGSSVPVTRDAGAVGEAGGTVPVGEVVASAAGLVVAVPVVVVADTAVVVALVVAVVVVVTVVTGTAVRVLWT